MSKERLLDVCKMARTATKKTSGSKVPPSGTAVIREVLKASLPRPTDADPQEKRNKYASRFADHMAKRIASDLGMRLKGTTSTAKRTARSVRGPKQLDINFSSPRLGLALGISLKSVHLRDRKNGRYTHNMKRNEEELRIEASGYHKRQPYAVMVGVLLLPFDSCDDGKKNNPSSFASWVRYLRPYTNRSGPDREIDCFESIYIALYEPDGNDLQFFDVAADPPKNGRPRTDGLLLNRDLRPQRMLSYAEFLDAVYHQYLQRNSAEFRWASGDEEPLDIDESEEGEEPEA